MSRFTVEESNLMCIYNIGSRTDLLSELTEMQSYLAADETELLALTKTVIDKLLAMSDEEFESLSGELIPDFEEQED
ncbi:transposon-transfer assisting family protein [Lachnospiraceae bacterium ZAX-1]